MFVTMGGDPGRYIAIILLIFQLVTSTGTFPLELLPHALQPIHDLLPMSYSVSAFRAVISSGDFSFMWENNRILLLFTGCCLAVTILFFQFLFKRQFSNQSIQE